MIDYTNVSTIYLSQSEGDDFFSGFNPTRMPGGGGPVKTIDRVLDILWNMRACGVLQPITIKIMGDYYLDSPIKIGSEYASSSFEQGYELKNITFESFGKEKSKIRSVLFHQLSDDGSMAYTLCNLYVHTCCGCYRA